MVGVYHECAYLHMSALTFTGWQSAWQPKPDAELEALLESEEQRRAITHSQLQVSHALDGLTRTPTLPPLPALAVACHMPVRRCRACVRAHAHAKLCRLHLLPMRSTLPKSRAQGLVDILNDPWQNMPAERRAKLTAYKEMIMDDFFPQGARAGLEA